MKKIVIGFILLFTAVNFSYAGGKHRPFLTVINDSAQTIRVSEGWLIKKEKVIAPGEMLDWLMVCDSIRNLLISYRNNGLWQQISGCPYGDYSTGIKVYIMPAPWDANTPICRQD